MLKLLQNEICDSRLKISTIEKELNQNPSYTYNTIRALREKHPHWQFAIIVGTDVKKELYKWYQFHKLKNLVEFIFIPRKGFESSPLPEISSTTIRQRIQSRQSLKNLTLKCIEEYIEKHHLYE